ncbi:MAG: hypothetical protein HKN36_10860 [Hellea sp.]|nr:hypothetical protein [Hellea sp.]
MNYWNNLVPRERLLLVSAGTLILVAALFFFAIRPVMKAKASGAVAQVSALQDYENLRANIAGLSGKSATNIGTKPLTRNAVIQGVDKRKLELSRIQPETGGAFKIWFDQASSKQVFGFISDITGDHAAIVSAVQLSRKKDGTVSATLTFRPTGGAS